MPFLVLPAHAAIWKQRGHSTTRGLPIKYGDQILSLLEAVHLPAEVSVSHCKEHLKGSMEVAWGNQAANQAAKRAALQNKDLIEVATLVPQTNLSEIPSHTEGEIVKAKSNGFQEDHMGWFQKEGLLFLPGNLQWKLVNSLHATTHLGEKAFQGLLERSFRGTGLQTTINGLLLSHLPIKQLPRSWPSLSNHLGPTQERTGRRISPDASFSRVYVPISHDRYIHRMDWRLSHPGWESWGGGKIKLLHEIIPSFGLSRSLQSDNGISLTSKGSLKHWALLIISIVPGGLSLQEK